MRRPVSFVAAAALLAPLLSGCGTSTKHDTATVTEPVRRVIVQVASGDVRVTGTTSDTIRLNRSARVRRANPKFERVLQDGVLRLSSRCNAGWFGACRVDERLEVPAHTEVEVHSGSGNVRVDRAAAAVDVSTGSGNIDVLRPGGVVSAHTGSGTVTVDRASDEVVAETGSGAIAATSVTARRFRAKTASGNIHVVFTDPPDDVDLQTGSGNIEAEVPKGAYQVDTGSSGGGSIEVKGLDKNNGSSRHVRAATASGNIKVSGR